MALFIPSHPCFCLFAVLSLGNKCIHGAGNKLSLGKARTYSGSRNIVIYLFINLFILINAKVTTKWKQTWFLFSRHLQLKGEIKYVQNQDSSHPIEWETNLLWVAYSSGDDNSHWHCHGRALVVCETGTPWHQGCVEGWWLEREHSRESGWQKWKQEGQKCLVCSENGQNLSGLQFHTHEWWVELRLESTFRPNLKVTRFTKVPF